MRPHAARRSLLSPLRGLTGALFGLVGCSPTEPHRGGKAGPADSSPAADSAETGEGDTPRDTAPDDETALPSDSGDSGDSGEPPAPLDACSPAPPLSTFITRVGDELYDGAEPLRFVSVNTPDLLGIVDPSWQIPTPWEQEDALCAVRQMGGKVARTYVLSVGAASGGVPRHVEGPGLLNEQQMISMDHALAAANRQGVRLIIPLVDQWWWVGGIAEHAAFRGLSSSDFWTDPTLIADFIDLIELVTARVNTVTGVPYAEDPAILAWETGNELYAPPEWTATVAAALKAADPNHLVLDGTYGIEVENLDDDNIDIVSDHYYWPPGYGADYAAAAADDRALSIGARPLLIGEFGLVPSDRVSDLLDEAYANGTTGVLAWSLRFHDEDGGFYWHDEYDDGTTRYAAYHWPGFDSGDAYDERGVLGLLTAAAARLGEAPAALPPPPPTLRSIDLNGDITWQGSAGAGTYALDRATDPDGEWTEVSAGFDDAVTPNEARTTDPSAPTSGEVWYRLRAIGAGGASLPSAPYGPVPMGVPFTDPLDDLSLMDSHDSALTIDSSNAARFDGDSARLTRTSAADTSATWRPGGTIAAAELRLFAWPSEALPTLLLAASVDGLTWTDVSVAPDDRGGDWTELRYRLSSLPAGTEHLRVTLSNPDGQTWSPQLSELSLLTRP